MFSFESRLVRGPLEASRKSLGLGQSSERASVWQLLGLRWSVLSSSKLDSVLDLLNLAQGCRISDKLLSGLILCAVVNMFHHVERPGGFATLLANILVSDLTFAFQHVFFGFVCCGAIEILLHTWFTTPGIVLSVFLNVIMVIIVFLF